MTWPWLKQRRERAAVRRDVTVASEEKHAAELRHSNAQWHAAKAEHVSARLRREIDKNGWTELLQHAWGGR